MSHEYWVGVEKEARERLKALRIMLDSLDVQRAERAKQILELEQLIRSLTPFTSEHPLDATERIVNNFGMVSSLAGLDLAEACRKVLQENDRYMSPREIRDMLEVNDYDLAQHPNHLASIHGVLKRLVESSDALMMAESRGVVYKWNTSGLKRPRRTARTGKPMPAWYERLTENGTKPLDLSKLTKRQEREAVELGLVNPVAMFGPPKRKVTKNE